LDGLYFDAPPRAVRRRTGLRGQSAKRGRTEAGLTRTEGAGKNKAGAASLGLAAPTHGNGHCPHPSNRLGIWIHRMPEVGSNINLSAPGINT